MTELQKYKKVNSCTSLKELSEVILELGEDGFIQGRIKSFRTGIMVQMCKNYTLERHNTLTRVYGIRQQAMMILFYTHTRDEFSKRV